MINKSTCAAAGPASGGRERLRARAGLTAGLAVAVLIGLAACKDSVVPNFRSPQINPHSPSGIQFLVTGVVSAMRINIGQDVLALSSFARDLGVFTATDQRFITEWMGNGTAIPNNDFYGAGGWSNEFRVAKDAQFVIDQLPHVTPAYSASDAALIAGIMKTFEAYSMMLVAETRDTAGVPVFGFVAPPSAPAPILCIKDVWGSIAAMLDSAEADLDAGTPGPLPVQLPPGFSAVKMAGPSGTAGTFAGFNRALAAYARLQQAYAVTRSPGGTRADSLGNPGAPSLVALALADTAVKHTFLYNPGALTPPAAGDFTDPLAVYHSFSGTSGDLTNPVTFSVGQTTNVFVLDTVAAEIAAGGDNRAAKLMVNTSPPGAPCTGCNGVVVNAMTVGFYRNAFSPVPIIRNEELVLIEAMIQLGLGNFANSVTSINAVRTGVGGVAPFAGATYVSIRDQILHELRASNIGEPGAERIMAVRNYGLQVQKTQTWVTSAAGETHATNLPIPVQESSPRKGTIAYTCTP